MIHILQSKLHACTTCIKSYLLDSSGIPGTEGHHKLLVEVKSQVL